MNKWPKSSVTTNRSPNLGSAGLDALALLAVSPCRYLKLESLPLFS